MKNLSIIAPALMLLAAPLAPASVLLSSASPMTVSGGGAGVILVDVTNDAGDWITSGGYDTGSATGALYFQVTMNITNNAGETGGGGFFSGFQLFKNGAENLALGNNWNSLNWGGFRGPGDFNLNGNPAYALNTPASFVVKLEQVSNMATIWFNANLSLTENAQSASSMTVLSGLGTADEFNALNLRAGNGTGSNTFSDIVVSTDSPFAAVPEPGSTLLLGLAGLGLIRRRR